MDELEFAQRLKRYRRERGLTQQELADRIGVSNKSVSRWESGSYPDVPTLLSLARALDVTVDALLRRTGGGTYRLRLIHGCHGGTAPPSAIRIVLN